MQFFYTKSGTWYLIPTIKLWTFKYDFTKDGKDGELKAFGMALSWLPYEVGFITERKVYK